MLTAGRKSFMACVCLALAALLLLTVAFKSGNLSDANFKVFTDFMVWIFGLFIGGNVGEHGFKALTAIQGPDAPTAPVADAPVKPAV